MLTFITVNNNPSYLPQVRELILQYQTALGVDLCFQNIVDELKNLLAKYAKPKGIIYLAMYNNTPVGCIAMQPINNNTVEMKRLYVIPTHRHLGIGKQLVQLLIAQAIKVGYTTMVLDTLHSLQAAITLYNKLGFVTTTAYYPNPLQGVVYMKKVLV